MMDKVRRSFETAAVFMLLSCWETDGSIKTIDIHSTWDCGDGFLYYGLNDYSEVNINFYKISGTRDCRISVGGNADYTRVCIKPELRNFTSCSVVVDVHKGRVDQGNEDEHYTCTSRTGSESCTYLNTITVIFKIIQGMYVDSRFKISFRIYPKEAEYSVKPTNKTHTVRPERIPEPIYTIMGIIIGGTVLLIIIIVVIICCCRKMRASNGSVYRNQQPIPLTAQYTYPHVQYSNVSPQADGYQPPPPQGNQPPHAQTVMHPTAYVCQPPLEGYQPQLQGYSAPPPTQGDHTPEMRKTPSAPPPNEYSMPPPPYPGD